MDDVFTTLQSLTQRRSATGLSLCCRCFHGKSSDERDFLVPPGQSFNVRLPHRNRMTPITFIFQIQA